MFQFKQSEATADRRRIFFYAVDATDGYTAITASITSGAVLIVKNGNTPGTTPVSPTFTHISSGLWYYEMTAAHLDTQGVLTVTITGTNIRTAQLIGYVYSGDPMAAIPTFPTNFSSLAITGSGAVTAGTVGDKTGYSLASGAITSTTFGADAITASVIANGAIDAATFAAGAITATVIADGAIDAATFANDAITAAVIANGAIDAATFADSALVIGSAAGLGVKAYLGSGSITAGVIATGAIDADAIATGAIDADSIASDAITAAKIANSAISIRLSTDGTASEARIEAGTVASDVWNAAYASYTTAGTFGKLMDTLRKANFVIEGTTTAGSTSTSVNTNLTGYVTNAFEHQTVLFISGALAGSCGLISASSSGGGTFTIDEALPGTPASGVDFVVLGTHVHTKQSIANTTWTTDISSVSISGQAGRYLTDAAIAATNASASASTIESVAYREDLADVLLGRNVAGGSNAGRLVKEALYALRNKSEIVGSTLNVYNATDGAIAWSAAVASSAGANPVTGVDPT